MDASVIKSISVELKFPQYVSPFEFLMHILPV